MYKLEDNLISARVAISDSQALIVDASEIEKITKRELAGKLGSELLKKIVIERSPGYGLQETVYSTSFYVFTDDDLIKFMREVRAMHRPTYKGEPL